MAITLTVDVHGAARVLHAVGEVDIVTSPTLRDELAALIAADRAPIVVDLTGVEFLDSTALGTLVNARRDHTDAGGAFAVVADNDRVTKLFAITGLENLFGLFPTVDAALAALPS